MSKLQAFARLIKVDEEKRQITGILADETPDASGEVFDYGTSKDHFVKWSGEVAKASDGKSVGNLRAQHGRVVAGRLNDIVMDDVQKSITITAEVVDDNEWNKVLKGCYTGFSVGGAYGKKWKDESLGKTRYTAKPTEASIVDIPCNPNSGFTVIKAAGAEEQVQFNPEMQEMRDLRQIVSEFDDEKLVKYLETVLDERLAKIASRSDTSPSEGESKYGDVTFADEKNKKYPIDTAAHIRAAWNYINKPKNSGKYSGADARAIRSKIIAAWKKKIDANGPPSAEKALEGVDLYKAWVLARADQLLHMDKAQAILKSVAALCSEQVLEKGLWTVGRLAELIGSVFDVQQCVAAEAAWEADGSILPDELKDAVKALGEILCHMADEEVSELFGDDDESELENAMKPEDLQKSIGDAVTKALEKPLGDLSKAFGEVTNSVTELEKRVKATEEKLEKVASQPAGGGIRLFAPKKEDEIQSQPGKGNDKVEKVLDNGQVSESATLIKAAHRTGGTPHIPLAKHVV